MACNLSNASFEIITLSIDIPASSEFVLLLSTFSPRRSLESSETLFSFLLAAVYAAYWLELEINRESVILNAPSPPCLAYAKCLAITVPKKRLAKIIKK